MIVATKSTQTFLSANGSLKPIPLSTKFGEIELEQLYRIAEHNQWKMENIEHRISQARLMVDANWASPKDHALLELEKRGKLHLVDGIEYWVVELDLNRAAGIYLNPDSYTLEVMVMNLEWFAPIHREKVTTLKRLIELTGVNTETKN
ncbi:MULTISPECIES: hypothetical protein [Planktothrix]|jgi:hypothetical protein|uniref:Uncharacterized protein n=2 Tax=Planktothrix TaxID=54304 RepID=A0A4P5ZHI9_PLAAG|nr:MULTISPECIES: hypothetical protein [Planktothrix]CAD5954062.1 hypothetical protein NO108_03106 [Planktothrix rubescens]CAC5344145.1 conserved hypothetical protein [Planktothrix rubescens NIVA-CYA 18]CAD0231850.1 conserved hypothetical protein [Planktothrix agardhii]CAD5912541.1 hypothetical protein PCC7821_00136 [Planktothrix rubescens NIVA-CYA 18]CAD5922460.1 hypothetical protein NO758_00751 [Planktothrix agardhii]